MTYALIREQQERARAAWEETRPQRERERAMAEYCRPRSLQERVFAEMRRPGWASRARARRDHRTP